MMTPMTIRTRNTGGHRSSSNRRRKRNIYFSCRVDAEPVAKKPRTGKCPAGTTQLLILYCWLAIWKLSSYIVFLWKARVSPYYLFLSCLIEFKLRLSWISIIKRISSALQHPCSQPIHFNFHTILSVSSHNFSNLI